MKRFILLLLFLLLTTGISWGEEQVLDTATYNLISNRLIQPFLTALKAGDVNSIKGFISKQMYEDRKTLLEENPEYGAFLRKVYDGVKFYPGKAVMTDKGIQFEVNMEYPGGGREVRLFQLKEDAGPFNDPGIGWKVDE